MHAMRKPESSAAPRKLAAAACALLLLCASAASQAAVRAHFDRARAQVGEPLTLIIESDDAQDRARPDLAPLAQNFDVLGTSTSSQMTLINGNSSSSKSWIVQLQPRHAGSIDIAPIVVGSERSNPLTLRVAQASPQAAQTSAHVFIEVEAGDAAKPIYVQQQIPYTVRLYYDDSVQNGDLAAPASPDVIVEQIGKEDRYSTTRNGRDYNVVVRRYALTPEKSGDLTIPAAKFSGEVMVATRQPIGTDPGDDLMRRMLRNTPFANDPLFKNSFFQGGLSGSFAFGAMPRAVVVRGKPIQLQVKPRPAAALGAWLPAAQLTLHDSWADDPPQFKVGEPVTRTVTIEARGLTATQIPKLLFAQPGNARVYPEAAHNESRSDGDTIFGVSQQSVTYIPSAQGKLDIAAIELPWWNTRTDTQSRASLPAREFQVAPGAAALQSNAAPLPSARRAQAGGSAARQTSAPAQTPPALSWIGRLRAHWAWLAAALSLLAAAAAFGYARRARSRKAAAPAADAAPAPQRKIVLQALHSACARNDAHAAARALLELARIEWPDAPPRSLGALAARVEAGVAEVHALDRSLYGAEAAPWQGAALAAALGQGLRPKRGEARAKDDDLAALYG